MYYFQQWGTRLVLALIQWIRLCNYSSLKYYCVLDIPWNKRSIPLGCQTVHRFYQVTYVRFDHTLLRLNYLPTTIVSKLIFLKFWQKTSAYHRLHLMISIKKRAIFPMMASSNRNIFRVTGRLSGGFTSDRWIPLTKASDAELLCVHGSAPNKWVSKQSRRRWF